jgi:hypothetical protein
LAPCSAGPSAACATDAAGSGCPLTGRPRRLVLTRLVPTGRPRRLVPVRRTPHHPAMTGMTLRTEAPNMISRYGMVPYRAQQPTPTITPSPYPSTSASPLPDHGPSRSLGTDRPGRMVVTVAAGTGPLPTAVPVLANRRVCGTCGGSGSRTEQVRRRDTCGRCGGAGGKKSGKVWVPCSGCGGKGGTDRTTHIRVTCRSCGGSGWR